MEPAWSPAIALFMTWLAAGNASKGTIKLRRHYMQGLARFAGVDPWAVTSQQILAWIAASSWSPEGKKSARASARSFYRWAHGEGFISADPSINLPRITVPRAKPRPTPDAVVSSALRRADSRERLMVKLGARGGLRRAEISAIRGTDLRDDNILRVVGKGGHVRLIPILDGELLTALHRAGSDYLFPGNYDGHISPDWTGRLLARLLGPGWTGHTLRHRFGTRALAGSKNLRAVQELLGHASPVTTAIYTAVVNLELIEAVAAAA